MTFSLRRLAPLLLVAASAAGCTQLIPRLAPSIPSEPDIGATFDLSGHFADVLDSRMYYVDEGQGPVVVLLHGNPTSSYLWRNIIPVLARHYRVIAPDLIGMGNSGKPDIDYTLQDHQRYFDALIETLGLRDLALVLHDWGGAIGLHYARGTPQNVRGIAMMEALIKPLRWEDAGFTGRYLFGKMRDDRAGYRLIVEQNYFLEQLLPMMSGRALSAAEMQAYLAPYPDAASLRPVRQWPLEIPFDGEPQRNFIDLAASYDFLTSTAIPLHFLHASPGVLFPEQFVAQLQADMPGATYTQVGEGLHYIQENHPRKIATTLLHWLAQIPDDQPVSAGANEAGAAAGGG